MPTRTNKLKNINDPVYGSIAIPSPLVFDVMEHPWFQRLRRIKQLGLTHYTFPSAQHTRFQHALGSMHLMGMAISVLRFKGIEITEAEAEGLTLAILLHDIGHGPFSHTLDQTLVRGISHEEISRLIIASLNKQFNGSLDIARQIFTGTYPKKFLHQLVSSQLDMDRLDYLARDSFFTGVAEGVISYERIIKMLTVYEDELVVEAKGVYSIEKFLISRRLMYWQVYLHKTVIAADQMLVNLLKRARFLRENKITLPATPELSLFLENHPTPEQFETESQWIETFAQLDDTDVIAAIKMWRHNPDPVLSNLCSDLLNRHLFRVELQKMPFDPNYVHQIQAQILRCYPIHPDELLYYFIHDTVENKAYNPLHDRIMIKGRNNDLLDISEASEQLNIAVLPTTVSKHLLCYPKKITV
ncbi:MAG TPA: HD domain-containing protein [Bacteroidales bacterium]|nr:HD domain-containing protein [Bacteroidales bacterium]HPT09940.1 HD domain-containing protein [Bacteroidales bacterium]